MSIEQIILIASAIVLIIITSIDIIDTIRAHRKLNDERDQMLDDLISEAKTLLDYFRC